MKQKLTQVVEIVKCIALLHNIITDIEGLHEFHQTIVAAWMQMAVLSLKKSRMHNCATVSAKQM